MSNVQLQGDSIVINRGRDSDVLNVRFRPIREFAPMTGRTLAINPFINVMLDKRAPGLWAGVIGGPKSKVEHLAELASKQGLVGQIAEIMLDSDLVRRINDKLIRNNQLQERRHDSGLHHASACRVFRHRRGVLNR